MGRLTNEEFLVWIEETYTVKDIVGLLIRYGICEGEDIVGGLAPHILELQDYLMVDYGVEYE
jgi:hypothetical protein